jgi:hypothetical protein
MKPVMSLAVFEERLYNLSNSLFVMYAKSRATYNWL